MKKLPKQTKGLIYKIIYMFRAHTKKKKTWSPGASIDIESGLW